STGAISSTPTVSLTVSQSLTSPPPNSALFPYTTLFRSDTLASITITSLPTTGTLKLGTVNVTVGQVISAASIANLTFVPNTNVTTQGSLHFNLTDSLGGTTSTTPATMTINVTPDAGPIA